MRVNVYIDGYNLYYGVLRGTPYRWLNVRELSERVLASMFPEFTLVHVRYFTALRRSADDSTSVDRQMAYLKALSTVADMSIHYGQYKERTSRYRLVDGSGYADVIRAEEKGSDVNLASMLILDAASNCFDVALVMSNDTDLLAPIRIVREHFAKAVGVAPPAYFRGRIPNAELITAADFAIPITRDFKSEIEASQFAAEFEHPVVGRVYRPSSWS